MLDKNYCSYFPNDSYIHRSNPIIKVLILFGIMLLSLFPNNIGILVSLFIVIMSCTFSFVPYGYYIHCLYSFRYLYFILIIIYFINNVSGYNFILILLSMTLAILYQMVILYTTSIAEVTNAIKTLLYPVRIFKINPSYIAIAISIYFYYIFIFLRAKNDVMDSCSIRGYDYRYSTFFGKTILAFKTVVNINKLSIIKSKKYIREMSQKLFFDNENKPSFYNSKYTIFDILFFLVIVCALLYSLIEALL